MKYGMVRGIPLVAALGFAVAALLPAEVAVVVVVGVAVVAIVVIMIATLARPKA